MAYRRPQEKKEFAQKIIDLARVTRVTAGGKRLRFRACVAVGDGKGRIGIGLAKGADVALAVEKASRKAEKSVINVTLVNETIPHAIIVKEGAARLFLKPAPRGTGVKAGGAVRVVLKLAGVPNVVSKIFGSRNKINNVRAVLVALKSFKPSSMVAKKKKEQVVPASQNVKE
ncbi:MAG: 30S ribosomal protein S5 [Candidatus Falkowbacteria bacterium]